MSKQGSYIASVLAVAALAATSGCTVANDTGPAGNAGAGSPGVTVVDAAIGNDAGVGGTVIPDDSAALPDTTTDGQAEDCYGDDSSADASVDAASPCDSLLYASVTCDDAGTVPDTLAACRFYAANARSGVFQALFDRCFSTVAAADACTNPDLVDCTRGVADFTCPLATEAVTLDGGATYGCAQVEASCTANSVLDDGGAVGISDDECHNWIDRFGLVWREHVFACYASQVVDASSCRAAFESCVFTP